MKELRDKVSIGARWDHEDQTPSFKEAKDMGLISYAELNAPQTINEEPDEIGLPYYAHSTQNAIASAFKPNKKLLNTVKFLADKYNTPWVGEHLCFLSPDVGGSVGYVINPILNQDFKDIAVENANYISKHYKRPIALELGPFYNLIGDYESEIDFINDVARESNSFIILDVAHLIVSNLNLGRAEDFGFDKIDPDRVVEIHLANFRASNSGKSWHDFHGTAPNKTVLNILKNKINNFKNLKAITVEIDTRAGKVPFIETLQLVNKIVKESINE